MKPQSGSKKSTIIVIITVIILAMVYFYMTGNAVPESATTLEVQSANTDSARILSLLNQIRLLNIDAKFFQTEAYQSLVDYSIEIPEVPVGRPNPFAPIPGVQIQTTR